MNKNQSDQEGLEQNRQQNHHAELNFAKFKFATLHIQSRPEYTDVPFNFSAAAAP